MFIWATLGLIPSEDSKIFRLKNRERRMQCSITSGVDVIIKFQCSRYNHSVCWNAALCLVKTHFSSTLRYLDQLIRFRTWPEVTSRSLRTLLQSKLKILAKCALTYRVGSDGFRMSQSLMSPSWQDANTWLFWRFHRAWNKLKITNPWGHLYKTFRVFTNYVADHKSYLFLDDLRPIPLSFDKKALVWSW